jgi:CBS domain-containing protein
MGHINIIGKKVSEILLLPEFEKLTCGEISKMFNRSFVPIDLSISLAIVVSEIVLTNVGRVIAFGDDGPIGVLSQSRIVNVLNPCLSSSRYGLKSIAELNIGLSETKCFQDSVTVSHVFNYLQGKAIPTVAICDDSWKFIGVVSVSDLRKVETLEMLAGGLDCEVSLKEFLQPTILKMKSTSTQYPIIVSTIQPFSDVLEIFQKRKVHHILLADNSTASESGQLGDRVVRVITLMDVLELVYNNFIKVKERKLSKGSHHHHHHHNHSTQDHDNINNQDQVKERKSPKGSHHHHNHNLDYRKKSEKTLEKK